MGHPKRSKQREQKKQHKHQEMLGRRTASDVLDLTPQNAVGMMRRREYDIRYK
ncbi:MAG: hypothetical protein NUK65_01020 [Firmicutes bacterium]|nr:hypothetical protein [Bacillota bacterium]